MLGVPEESKSFFPPALLVLLLLMLLLLASEASDAVEKDAVGVKPPSGPPPAGVPGIEKEALDVRFCCSTRAMAAANSFCREAGTGLKLAVRLEQSAQKMSPQKRQWCRRVKKEKLAPQPPAHSARAKSGSQRAGTTPKKLSLTICECRGTGNTDPRSAAIAPSPELAWKEGMKERRNEGKREKVEGGNANGENGNGRGLDLQNCLQSKTASRSLRNSMLVQGDAEHFFLPIRYVQGAPHSK